MNVSDDDRATRIKSGMPRVKSELHWARAYLVWAGLLDFSRRGWWSLTPEGWALNVDEEDPASAHELFKQVRRDHAFGGRKASMTGSSEDEDEAEEEAEEPIALDQEESAEINLAAELRTTLQGLRHSGFETMCSRLLQSLGLVQLRKVGQAGDRGIDVEGHIRLNAVVSFRVGVQCKLYGTGNKITPNQIRELQGALGPFDRGIFITTSVFTKHAEEQASAPGYKPIDLIDGERLLELLREHQLGVKTVVVVDHAFFEPFRKLPDDPVDAV